MTPTYEQIILTIWPTAYKHLKPAIDMMQGLHDGRSVLQLVLGRDAELWMAPHGAIVTEEIVYPYGKAQHFWLAGGRLDELIDMHDEIIAWSVKRGCTHSTFGGRDGWARKLSGYKRAGALWIKRIDT